MPVFRKDGLDVLFVHVPKAGGTSIEYLFHNNGWRTRYRDPRHGPDSLNHLRRCPPQHMHAELLEQMFRLNRFDAVFLTVRNPITRFRSECAMRSTDERAPSAAAVEKWYGEAMDLLAGNPWTFENHLRPQVDFVVPGAAVYKLEDGLEKAVEDLNQRFGLGLAGPLRRMMDRHTISGFSSKDVPISDSLAARIREDYRADFEHFGYA
jgi:hypothetical protein